MFRLKNLKKQTENARHLPTEKLMRYGSGERQMRRVNPQPAVKIIPTSPTADSRQRVAYFPKNTKKTNVLTARSSSPETLRCVSITSPITDSELKEKMNDDKIFDSEASSIGDLQLLSQSRRLYDEVRRDLEYYRTKALYAEEEAEYLREKLLKLFNQR